MNRKLIESMALLNDIEKDAQLCGISESNIINLKKILINKINEANNNQSQVKSIGLIGEIKALISRLIAWIVNLLHKIKNIFSKDYTFLKRYSPALAINAHKLNNIQIQLPKLVDPKSICDIDVLFHPSLFDENMGNLDNYYNDIINKIAKAINQLKNITIDTTIGQVGGIKAIINTMEDNNQYQIIYGFQRYIDYLENINFKISCFSNEDKEAANLNITTSKDVTNLWIKAMRDMTNYMFASTIAKQKAYKAALIKAIAKVSNTNKATTDEALESVNYTFNKFIDHIHEVFSDNVFGTLDTTKVIDINANPDVVNLPSKDLSLEDIIDKEKLAEFVSAQILNKSVLNENYINKNDISEFNKFWISIGGEF